MTLMIKEMSKSERPRERLLKYGVESLSNAEILSIILKTGTKNINVLEVSNNLINKIDGFLNLKNVNKEILIKEKGIGEVKAVELLAAIELGKRLFTKKDLEEKKKYLTSKEVFNDNKDLFIDVKQEYFYCIYLNSNKEVIERKMLFMGTVNRSLVHPREIFKEAYLLSASSIICIHNHPSGDPTPSFDDVVLTKNLIEIGNIQKIPVIDHIIFGEDRYYSFYEDNKLKG